MKKSVNQKVACMLVGNKLDMDSRRTVSTEEGQALGIHITKLADKYEIPFAETSAKTSQNVENIFQSLTDKILNNSDGKSPKPKLKPEVPLNQKIKKEEEYCTCCEG